jgi:hypothetical protein
VLAVAITSGVCVAECLCGVEINLTTRGDWTAFWGHVHLEHARWLQHFEMLNGNPRAPETDDFHLRLAQALADLVVVKRELDSAQRHARQCERKREQAEQKLECVLACADDIDSKRRDDLAEFGEILAQQRTEQDRHADRLDRALGGVLDAFEGCIPEEEITHEMRVLRRLAESDSGSSAVVQFMTCTLQNLDRSPHARRYPDIVKMLWLLLRTYGGKRIYTIWAANFAGPSLSHIDALSDATVMDPGIHQRSFDDAMAYFLSLGVDVSKSGFQVCMDAMRITDVLEYDKRRRGVLGFASVEPVAFDSYEDLKQAYDAEAAAKFVLFFLITVLDGNLPSAYRIVAIIPQPAKFGSEQVRMWKSQILQCARAAGFTNAMVVGGDGDSRHRKLALTDMRNRQGEHFVGPKLSPLLTLYPIFDQGSSSPHTIMSDPSHWLKKVCQSQAARLMYLLQTWCNALSLNRLIVMGSCPVLLTHVSTVYSSVRAGLRAQDVNGVDRQSVESAKRFIAQPVRKAMQDIPGTRSTVVYLYTSACLCAAFFNRTASIRTRISLAFQVLHFVRLWKAWVKASEHYTVSANYISLQLHADTIIAVHSLVLSALIWQQKFPGRVFPAWLLGSDQLEHLFSEMRAFVRNNSNPTLLQLLSIARRYSHLRDLLAKFCLRMESIVSSSTYNPHIYVSGLKPPLSADVCSEDQFVEAYHAGFQSAQRLATFVGMEPVLKEAKLWDTPQMETLREIEIELQDASEDIDGSADILEEEAVAADDQVFYTSESVSAASDQKDCQAQSPSLRTLTEDALQYAPAMYEREDSGFMIEPVLDPSWNDTQILVAICGQDNVHVISEDDVKLNPSDYVLVAGQLVHKRAAIVHMQADKFRKLKQGRDRVKQHALDGVRFEDGAGDGFHVGQAYQFQTIISESDDKKVHVKTGVALIEEIRKRFGKRQYTRMSVAKSDQSSCAAVLRVFERSGDVLVKSAQPYRVIPMSELGCKVNIEAISAACVSYRRLAVVRDCGGAHMEYDDKRIPNSAFGSSKMLVVDRALSSSWTVAEIKAELKARKETCSGLKTELLGKLRLVCVRAWLDCQRQLPEAPAPELNFDPFGGMAYSGDLGLVRNASSMADWTSEHLRAVCLYHKDQPRFSRVALQLDPGTRRDVLLSQVRSLVELDELLPVTRANTHTMPASADEEVWFVSSDNHTDALVTETEKSAAQPAERTQETKLPFACVLGRFPRSRFEHFKSTRRRTRQTAWVEVRADWKQREPAAHCDRRV